MKRKLEESGLDYVLVPDVKKTRYGDHVGQRAEAFCLLLYKVALLCKKYQPPQPFTQYLTDHAEIQVDQGIYAKDREKIDAAHLCNTSFKSDKFVGPLTGLSATEAEALSGYCRALCTLSGATTPQAKSDNVGPDKVIDSFQTEFKNKYLRKLAADPAFVIDPLHMWNDYVTDLNTALVNSKSKSFTQTSSGGYEGGRAALAQMADLRTDVMNGHVDWALCEEFKITAATIDSL